MLKCHHCRGVFSKEMIREGINGNVYHAYCAGKVRRTNPVNWFWWPTLVLSFWRIG